MEAVIVRVMEVVFPKLQKGKYVAENHDLWYDKGKNRYRNFDSLLENIKNKAANFDEDKDLLLEMISRIKPFKNETNACVHSDHKILDEGDIISWKIPLLIDLLRKLFKKYCSS